MRAIVWTRYGPPEVLQLEEVERPTPKDDEVLVKVHATSAFAGDGELRRFQIAPSLWLWARLYIGLTRPKRITILGQEMAGVVESVGKDVTRFKVGDEVFGISGPQMGTYAEFVRIPQDAPMVRKPTNLSFEEAAVLSAGGLEALHFHRKANIRDGQKVLINGAGGSIGTMALQLAKMSGAMVTCVDSAEKLGMLTGLGADAVIDYSKDDFTNEQEAYDVVFDVVGKISFLRTMRSLKKDGILILGNSGVAYPKLLGLWASIMGGRRAVSNLTAGTTDDLEQLKDLVTSGRVKIVIDKRFPLERAADAHRYLETGSKRGNVVITVIEERSGHDDRA